MKTDKVYKLDQFFTKSSVAQKCIDRVREFYNFSVFSRIIEPSAGTGSFYNLLPKENRVGVELDPELCQKQPEFKEMSFFKYTVSPNSIVIGNPPFGTQSKLAIDFFNYAACSTQVIAFIIPRTWKKPSVQNRLDLNFHLVDSFDIEDNAFEGDKETAVKCCFQIWERRDYPRAKILLPTKHKDWDFLSYSISGKELLPPTNADFTMLAYGSSPGLISSDLNRWRPKSVHYIKSNIDTETLKNRFCQLDFSGAQNSARQGSLGRAELVSLYSQQF